MINDKYIGLYGGAFDPVHNAHLTIAENCINQIGLNKVIFIPTGNSPNKKKMESFEHRIQMLSLALDKDYFEISKFEIEQYKKFNKISYTIDTLKFFNRNINNTYLFILGNDSFSSINTWYKWKDILKYSHLLLIDRDLNNLKENFICKEIENFSKKYLTKNINDLKQKRNGYIYKIHMPLVENSSSEIKNKLQKNIKISSLLPLEVEKHIIKNKLYKFSGQTI